MNDLLTLLRRIFGRAPLHGTPPPSPPPPTTLVEAFNLERAKAGLGPLIEDPRLVATAVAWAAAMAGSGRISHDGFPGRIDAVYPGVPIGEIVARGYDDLPSAVAGWMASPPHRAEILGPYTHAGGGAKRSPGGARYWCGQFAKVAR
jgi:uncharacterized protein YkwD